MFKKLFSLLIIPLFSLSQICFEEVDNKDSCHVCPGFLVVTKNELHGIIETGSWGKVDGDYSVKTINGEKYILVESEYFGNGVLQKGIHIFSTTQKQFLKTIFAKNYITDYSTYVWLDNGLLETTSIKKKISYDFEDNYINIKLDTIVFINIDNELEGPGKMISQGIRKERHLLNLN